MKAAVLYGDYDMRYEEYPEPEVKAGYVKIKVCVCGVCGSDIPRITKGGAHYYPIVLGHEMSGYVAELGEGVDDLELGTQVSVAPLVPCMECEDCKKGYYSQCKHYTFIGSRIQGGFADYLVVPRGNVVPFSKKISYEAAAMLEPTSVALHGIRTARYQGGGSVAILGGGTIGTLTLQWVKAMGAEEVTVFGRSKEHLQLSTRLGADHVISTLDEDFMDEALKITGGRGYDYVLETAGAIPTMKYCYELVGNHGTICMIGTPTQNIEFTQKEWELMNRKEFLLTGSWMSGNSPYPGDEWSNSAEGLISGKIRIVDEMFHDKIPYQEISRLTDTLKNTKKLNGRILLLNQED